jgi:uncharacterized protein YjiS (DUF1127 family)
MRHIPQLLDPFHTPQKATSALAGFAAGRILDQALEGRSELGAAVAVAVVRRKEREVRDDFRRAGALQALDARSLADVGLENNFIVRRMIKRAVIHESEPGLYYFDEEVWQSVRAWRRRRAIGVLVVVAVVAIITLYVMSVFR